MHVEQIRDQVVAALEDVKAFDIAVLDVRGKTSITDFMIIASGRTDRQVKSLAQSVLDVMKSQGVLPIGVEGEREGEWVVVDLVDVVVHIFIPEKRDFYNLEKLWGETAPDAGAAPSA